MDYKEVKRKFRDIVGAEKSLFFHAKVDSVSENTCNVKYGDLLLTDVSLTATEGSEDNRITVKPKLNSNVLVCDLSGGELRRLVVSKYSEIDKIRIESGDENLGNLVRDMIATLKEAVIQTPSGPGNFSPDVILALTELDTKFKTILDNAQ